MGDKSSKLGSVFGKPVHGVFRECDKLVIPDAKVGIEIELEEWDGSEPRPRHLWAATPDHSLRNNGIEFTTTGSGLVGEEILEAVYGFCESAKTNKWGIGYPRAGIHIHLDVTDLDLEKKELLNLVTNYMLVESVLFTFAGNWRRACGFCVPYSEHSTDSEAIAKLICSKPEDLGKYSKEYLRLCSKYKAVNLIPLGSFGTIEFRQLPTTFDPERIIKWINIILAIKKSSQEALWIDNSPLKELSSLGTHHVVKKILGAALSDVEIDKNSDPQDVWAACDCAMELMALGENFHHTSLLGSGRKITNALVLKKFPQQMLNPKKITGEQKTLNLYVNNPIFMRNHAPDPLRTAQEEGDF